MVDARLTNYIQQQLKNGYNINSIRNYLVKYGYPAKAVDDAITQAYPMHEVKHTIHLSPVTIGVVAVALLLIIGSVFAFLAFMPKNKEALLDIKLIEVPQQASPGENLAFTANVLNMGGNNRFDIILRNELISSDGEIVNFEEETKAIETSLSANFVINVPFDAKGGRYILKTSAIYEGKKASATKPIIIVKQQVQPTCDDGIKNQDEEDIDCGGPCTACKKCPASCDDNIKCTKDYCGQETFFECRHDTIVPCCGNNICEAGETENSCNNDCLGNTGLNTNEKKDIIDEIADIALRDKGKAIDECKKLGKGAYSSVCWREVGLAAKDASLCDNIDTENNKENCYMVIAKELEDPALCENINNEGRKDGCYMGFVMEGDYSVCDKILNDFGRRSCENLREMDS